MGNQKLDFAKRGAYLHAYSGWSYDPSWAAFARDLGGETNTNLKAASKDQALTRPLPFGQRLTK